jgi:hypothetical protein
MFRGSRRRQVHILLIVLTGIGVSAMSSFLQSQASQSNAEEIQRLILKDGSYESTSQYEVLNDRVRYYSLDRHVWEELPETLIDWPATKRYAEQNSSDAADRRMKLLDQAAKERSMEEARMPKIAPGMRLPSPNGVYLLDVYQQKTELVQLFQNSADRNKNMKANILRGAINPVSSSKHTLELQGSHARTQVHVRTPEIFFFVDPDDSAAGYTAKNAAGHLRIVRCEKKKENRVVMTFKIAIYGKVKETAQYIKTHVESISEYWVKIIPLDPLEPGEYALVEWDDKGAANQYVWDFGVNPLAPPNAATRAVESEKSKPVLIEKREKQPIAD